MVIRLTWKMPAALLGMGAIGFGSVRFLGLGDLSRIDRPVRTRVAVARVRSFDQTAPGHRRAAFSRLADSPPGYHLAAGLDSRHFAARRLYWVRPVRSV